MPFLHAWARGVTTFAWEQRRSDWRWRVGSNRSRRRLVRLVQGPYVHAAAETRERKGEREAWRSCVSWAWSCAAWALGREDTHVSTRWHSWAKRRAMERPGAAEPMQNWARVWASSLAWAVVL